MISPSGVQVMYIFLQPRFHGVKWVTMFHQRRNGWPYQILEKTDSTQDGPTTIVFISFLLFPIQFQPVQIPILHAKHATTACTTLGTSGSILHLF